LEKEKEDELREKVEKWYYGNEDENGSPKDNGF
jgi:hypothetical protein